ncbi:MAG: transglutaminase family protein [Armatimonadota bacterium]
MKEAQDNTPVSNLPLFLTGTILLAFAGLYWVSGSPWLPVAFALGVLATYLIPLRMASESATWVFRFTLILLALFATFLGGAGAEGLVNERWMNLFGALLAAECVVQAWRRHPGIAALYVLPCIIYLVVGNTYEPHKLHLLTPAFVLCLALSLPWYRARAGKAPRGMRLLGLLLLAGALVLGAGFDGLVALYRAEINNLGTGLFNQAETNTIGLSLDPVLGRTFGQRGSAQRVLRLMGYRGDGYLRATAFDTYDHGRWGPGLKNRPMSPLPPNVMRGNAPGSRVQVVKYASLDNLLLTTLDTVGARVEATVNWCPTRGGPIQGTDPTPLNYELVLRQQGKGSLWPPYGPKQRNELLQVPPEIDRQVLALAQQIGGQEAGATRKIMAVTNYLTTHHAYSLSTDPGRGDQVSNFLLQRKNAHCEYFAASATILLRCLGVPTRYVVGYYAHESGLDGATIVRQRDAHAWAESWVEGAGWVVVEATPGNGRPDGSLENLPSWALRTQEWLQDTLQRLRNWVLTLPPPQLALFIVAIIAPYFLWQIWHTRRGRKRIHTRSGDYTITDQELAALALRFTTWLARAGYPCPSARPWQEHLAEVDHPTAREFVRRYTIARFGKAPGGVELERLIAELEKEPVKKQAGS